MYSNVQFQPMKCTISVNEIIEMYNVRYNISHCKIHFKPMSGTISAIVRYILSQCQVQFREYRKGKTNRKLIVKPFLMQKYLNFFFLAPF